MPLPRASHAAVLAASLLLLGCAGAEKSQRVAETDTFAEGVRLFLRNPDGRNARISPDGTRVALITTIARRDTILVWHLASMDKKPILRFPDLDAQLTWVEWANDRRLIFGVDVPLLWSRGVRFGKAFAAEAR